MMNKVLLEEISQRAIELGDFNFSGEIMDTKWLGNNPASAEDILKLEKRLGVKLPPDYVAFLGITNGFAAPCASESTFMPINNVDYLRNIDAELIAIWRETGNEETADILHRSICIGGAGEEQLFLLVPPLADDGTWLYWKFAAWIPGEKAFDGLMDYFEYVDSFIKEIIGDRRNSPRQIATAYLTHLSNGDLEALLALFHKAGTVKSPLYGLMDCRSFYTQLFEDTRNSTLELIGVFEDMISGNIAIHFNYSWTLKNDTKVEFEVVDIVEFDKKMKIKKLTIIYDTVQSRPLVGNL